MHARNLSLVQIDNLSIDKDLLELSVDRRQGIGLFSFVSEPLDQNFMILLEDLKSSFLDQLIYLPKPALLNTGLIHHTFFQLAKVESSLTPLIGLNIPDYLDIIKDILFELGSYTIDLSRIIAVPTGLLMCGYPSKNINKYRENIRNRLNKPLDEPYKTNIAHTSILRLASKNVLGSDLVHFVSKYADINFGSFNVNDLYLGFGTWRMHPSETKMLYRFDLVNKVLSKV